MKIMDNLDSLHDMLNVSCKNLSTYELFILRRWIFTAMYFMHREHFEIPEFLNTLKNVVDFILDERDYI